MTDVISTKRLIFMPSVITLAVTLLRLFGELQHWSKAWFNTDAGGGGALIGIAWLAPLFGIYFAVQLTKAGAGPAHAGRAIAYAGLGLVIVIGGSFLAALLPRIHLRLGFFGQLLYFSALLVVGALPPFRAWPALAKTLLAYGLAARLPVIVVMFFAFLGQWGTHYDALPPNVPAMSLGSKFFWLGVLPQLTLWIGFTIIIGSLFGSVAAVFLRRRQPMRPATV